MALISYRRAYADAITSLARQGVIVSVASPQVYLSGFPLFIASILGEVARSLAAMRARVVLYPRAVQIVFPDLLVEILAGRGIEIRLSSAQITRCILLLRRILALLENAVFRGGREDLLEMYILIRDILSRTVLNSLILSPDLVKIVYELYKQADELSKKTRDKTVLLAKRCAETILRILDRYSDVLPHIMKRIFLAFRRGQQERQATSSS